MPNRPHVVNDLTPFFTQFGVRNQCAVVDLIAGGQLLCAARQWGLGIVSGAFARMVCFSASVTEDSRRQFDSAVRAEWTDPAVLQNLRPERTPGYRSHHLIQLTPLADSAHGPS